MNEQPVSATDRLDILDLLGRYFFAIDSGEAEAVIGCFTRDGIVEYDSGDRYEGPEGLKRFAAKAIGGEETRGRMHLNYPLFFKRQGDVVILSSYLSAAQWRLPNPPQAFGSLRFIEDHCVKVDGFWRIQKRSINLWNDQTVGRFGSKS